MEDHPQREEVLVVHQPEGLQQYLMVLYFQVFCPKAG